MDPDANLQEQEQEQDRILDGERVLTSLAAHRAETERLLDLRQALYDWIRDGGFEPDWSKAPNAAKYYGR